MAARLDISNVSYLEAQWDITCGLKGKNCVDMDVDQPHGPIFALCESLYGRTRVL